MKQRPILFSTPMVQAILDGRKTQTRRVINPQPPEKFSNFGKAIAFGTDKTLNHTVHCPYGEPGDVLWVRETFSPFEAVIRIPRDYKYKADNDNLHKNIKWKPSIFMPKSACRIFLEITNVRVERLHNISGEDCLSEGIVRDPTGLARVGFVKLWESINGKASWNVNPWVWALAFKRIENPNAAV